MKKINYKITYYTTTIEAQKTLIKLTLLFFNKNLKNQFGFSSFISTNNSEESFPDYYFQYY